MKTPPVKPLALLQWVRDEVLRLAGKIDGLRVDGIAMVNQPRVLSLSVQQPKSPRTHAAPLRTPGRIISSVADGTNRWLYTVRLVDKPTAGYGGWVDNTSVPAVQARSILEDGSGCTCPEPIGNGCLVMMFTVGVAANPPVTEYWFD